MGNIYTGSNTGKAGLEVTDENGTPDVFGVSQIIVSDGTLTDNGDGSVTIQTGGGGGGGSVTSVDVSGGTTGLTTSGGPITGAGTITISGVLETTNGGTGLSAIGTANQFLKVNSLGTALEYATVNTGVDGTGAANEVAYWSDSDTIAGDTGLTYIPTGGSRQLKITDNGVSDMFVIESTDDGTTNAPDIKFFRNSNSPADGDKLGVVKFNGIRSGAEFEYAQIISQITSSSSLTGRLAFGVQANTDFTGAGFRELLAIDGRLGGGIELGSIAKPANVTYFTNIGGTKIPFQIRGSDGLIDFAGIRNYGTLNAGGAATTLDGEILIGNATAGQFSKGTLASSGGTITITNGAGTINLETAGGYSNWRASDGSNTDEVENGDTLTFTGGTGITTTLTGTGGATPNLTIDVDSSTIPSGSGVANQVTYWSGANTITGDTGLTYNSTPGSRLLSLEDSSAGTMFQVKSTDGGGGSAPDIVFVKDSATPASGDDLGVIVFKGNDDGGAEQEFARISAEANTVTAGSEDGQLDFRVFQAGSITSPMRITEDGVFVNIANNANLDFVVDTLNQDGAFRVDSSADDIRTLVPFRDEIEIHSTDTGAAVAPDLKLFRNSASPAANDVLGQVLFSGQDDAAQKINYASITGFAVDIATAQPDGAIVFNCLRNGTSAPYFDIGKLVSGVRAMTVNPNALDNDFYIKTVNQNEAFKIDGSADTATFNVPVTITVNNLDAALTVESTDSTTGSNSSPDIFLKSAKSADGDYLGAIYLQGKNSVAATTSYAKILSRIDTATDGDESGVLFTSIPHQGTDRTFSYFEGGSGGTNGRVSFNYNAKDIDFGVLNQGVGDGGPGGFAIFAQAETGEIGINNSSPSATLHVKIPSVATNTQALMIESEDDGSSTGPQFLLLRDSATPAANDDIGIIRFQGKNDGAGTVNYADMFSDILDTTAGAEAGRMYFRVATTTNSGNMRDMITLRGDGNPAVVINDGSHSDVDFRVETDSQANALLIDASDNDAVFNIPVTINQQSNALSTDFALQLTEDTADANQSPDFFLFKNSATPTNGDDIGSIQFYGNNAPSSGGAKNLKHLYGSIVMDMADVITNQESGRMFFQILKDGTLRQGVTIRGDGAGSVVIGDGNVGLGADGLDFRVETTSQNSAFEIDTSADTATFNVPLTINDYTLPTADGNAGEVITTDGAGTLSFAAAGGGSATPAGSNTEIQFNNAGAFGAESRFTYNTTVPVGNPHIFTVGSALGIGSGTPVNFFQTAGDSGGASGGTITSSTTELSAVFSKGFAPFNEINGFKYQPTDNQFKTGTTTTQSFGQTQKTILAAGTYDCYPQQGGLIVVGGNSAAITINLTLAQDLGGRYDGNAPPFNVPSVPTGTSDLAGYGTWQIGDQVTVLANLIVGQTPNITIRSYNSVYDQFLPASNATPTDASGTATEINGVNSSTAGGGQQTITTNFTAKTFILVEDVGGLGLGVQWVCIG